jgi:hypothetical protein
MNVATEVKREKQHQDSRKVAILKLLKEAGARGLTNVQLNEICFRYGGRLFELRKAGFEIETKAEGAGVYRFIFRGKKQAQRELTFA